jgi:ubiquinone/menaquinone biosynthesis C-methylase UbiE
MSNSAVAHHDESAFAAHLSVEKMPAHWLFARLGKRVLRPGGLETTRWLLDTTDVGESDVVVELAPGLGVTARAILSRAPGDYVGVERDAEALAFTRLALDGAGFPDARLVEGDAASVPLEDGSATVVIGEAMLSMQTERKKHAIIAEASRVLCEGGRYAIHELAVGPADIDDAHLERIEHDLSKAIHVGVRIGTVSRWCGWLAEHGFEVEALTTAPMRLLEPDRLLRDEGALGAARFAWNALRTKGAVERLRTVRATFRAHASELCAVAIVARRGPLG